MPEMVDVFAGTVIWFSEERGYGFLEVDGDMTGTNVFLHACACVGKFKPVKGQRLQFEMAADGERGWRARHAGPLAAPQ
jgi:cold shock CspA family protein